MTYEGSSGSSSFFIGSRELNAFGGGSSLATDQPSGDAARLVKLYMAHDILHASIRNFAHRISCVRARGFAWVIAWNKRSSVRAEQRLNRVWHGFGSVVQVVIKKLRKI
jgi:hypothetical protein